MTTETTSPLSILQSDRLRIFLHALLFVAGFSLVFIIGWGGSVTLLGQVFGAYKRVIAQIGGLVVIIFGLATLGVIRIPWFYADTRAIYGSTRHLRRIGTHGHFLRRRLEPMYWRNFGRDPDNGTEPANRGASHVALVRIFAWFGNSISHHGNWIGARHRLDQTCSALPPSHSNCKWCFPHYHRHTTPNQHDEPDFHLGIQERLLY